MLMPISIIPQPVEVIPLDGTFTLTPETVIVSDTANRANAEYLAALLRTPTGFALPIQDKGSASGAEIGLIQAEERDLPLEAGYSLSVDGSGIRIRGAQPAGVFHGIQSLRQLLPVQIEKREPAPGIEWTLPCVTIRDWPRFAWRGMMLDEGRHFQGKQTVFETLELMALQKLNVLHWHITEDQGWRIEIKRYPRLTEYGSRRAGTSRGFTGRHNGVPHGGFYTQDDVREIVAYAAARHILVVPEIEFPGHSLAALACYPELSCTGGPFEVATHFGIYPELYCAGNEAVFTFLEGVLDEMLALFPAPFVHIGGDEAPKTRWKNCPKCQARMQAEGLQDEAALQVYFTNRISKYLAAHGRRVVGWNQILGGGLDKSAIPQWWAIGRKQFVQAVKDGHQAIISSFMEAYLDHSHETTSLSRAYRFEPVFPELQAHATNILGLEAPLWAEFVRSKARLDFQVYPRLCAYAETGWTPREGKDLAGFRARLAAFLPRLEAHGVRYARGKEAEPSWLAQKLAIFTMFNPQEKVAEE
jgi:hexosaminidase